MTAFSEYRGVPIWKVGDKFFCPMDGNIAYDTFSLACEAISEALDEYDINEVPAWMSADNIAQEEMIAVELADKVSRRLEARGKADYEERGHGWYA